jgi:hypothetical protein
MTDQKTTDLSETEKTKLNIIAGLTSNTLYKLKNTKDIVSKELLDEQQFPAESRWMIAEKTLEQLQNVNNLIDPTIEETAAIQKHLDTTRKQIDASDITNPDTALQHLSDAIGEVNMKGDNPQATNLNAAIFKTAQKTMEGNNTTTLEEIEKTLDFKLILTESILVTQNKADELQAQASGFGTIDKTKIKAKPNCQNHQIASQKDKTK